MCGACGTDRGAGDWARPLLAGLAPRTSVASAANRLLASGGGRGAKVTAGPGGWLVRSPTGAVTDCATLGALVAAVRPWLGESRPFPADAAASGALLTPPPDARRPVRLRIEDRASGGALSEMSDTVVVGCPLAALEVLGQLSRPPWSARRYLAGVDGTDARWAGRPWEVSAPSAEHGADLVLWVEHQRSLGGWDDAAVLARCPLDDLGTELRVELRAGHVVRAHAVVPVHPAGPPHPAGH